MDWRDTGAVLSVRRHGESAAIIEVFTAAHGRHAGIVRGGVSRRLAPVLQPGVRLDLTWRARLPDHIGSFRVEPLPGGALSPVVLGDPLALAGLNAICAMLRIGLPEREPHAALYRATMVLLAGLGRGADWPLAYLRWELMLLEELGYGLDLSACALTGSREDLAFVSPKTGRAVAREAASDWAARLLPLPACLLGQGPAGPGELTLGLGVTGHFLERHLAHDAGNPALPAARERLIAALSRQS